MKHNKSTLHSPNYKLWITMLTAGICIVLSVACLSTSGKKMSHFQRAEVREGKTFGKVFLNIRSGNYPPEETYALSESLETAVGVDTTDGEWLWRVCLIDKHDNRILYDSDVYDGDTWWLNVCKTRTHTFLLWEFETEYASILPLYVYSHESKQFAYVGEFHVELYDLHADWIPYPVKNIDISFSDTLTTFTFTKKLNLYEPGTNSLVADSLMYELDLRNNSLRISKIWGEKQIEVPK